MGIKKENRGILSKSLSNGKGVDKRIMTELDANKKAEELLKGAYDLHVHSSPSVFPRELDGFQLVREADAAGMAGVMLKSHYESTALRAELINRYSDCKAKAYGGLCLNWPAGGLNVYAVKNALRAGARLYGCRPGMRKIAWYSETWREISSTEGVLPFWNRMEH